MFESKKTNNHQESSSGAEERIGALFQPDTLANHQFTDTYRRQLPLEPEQRLVIAVLEDGINTFQDNCGAQHPRKRRLFEEAEAWIFADEQDWIFSFSSVCALLDLNPDYLRRGLRQWQAQGGCGTKRKTESSGSAPRRRAA
ncbi:MAG: hypothetical protein FJ145_16165 [Deltaproteobacteria bacterium]|nr:hypothetical protein [Deltaproteobacteria bacterium]